MSVSLDGTEVRLVKTRYNDAVPLDEISENIEEVSVFMNILMNQCHLLMKY